MYIRWLLKAELGNNVEITKPIMLNIIRRTFTDAIKVKHKFGVDKRLLTHTELEYIYDSIFKSPSLINDDLEPTLYIFTYLLQTLHSYDNSGYWNLHLLHFIEKIPAEHSVTIPGDVILRVSMQTGALALVVRMADLSYNHIIISTASNAQILAQTLLGDNNVKRLVVMKNGVLDGINKIDILKKFTKPTGSTSVNKPDSYNDFSALSK